MIMDIIKIGASIIDKVIPNAEEKEKAKLALLQMEQSGELEWLKNQSAVVVAEAQGDSWLQRSWRPLVMLLFAAIIANNYLIAPILKSIHINYVMLSIPNQMWDLLKLGLSGYIMGRSGEKIAKAILEKNKKITS